MTELVLQRPATVDTVWTTVCRLEELEVGWGEAVLITEVQIALFRLPGDVLHAVGNIDPRTRAAVMARGIVGSRGPVTTLTSPLHKEVYDLSDGTCLGGGPALPVYRTRCVLGTVEIGPVRTSGAG